MEYLHNKSKESGFRGRKLRRRLCWSCLVLLSIVGLTAVALLAGAGRPGRWPSAFAGFVLDRYILGPASTWWGPLVRTAAIKGSFAYIGLGTEMEVVDISDPTRPRLVKKMFNGGIAHGFSQTNDTLFLAAGPAGLTAFDIRDPGRPTIAGRFRSFGYGMHCAFQNNLVLLSNEMEGWVLLDVSDPTDIRKIVSMDGGWVSAATWDGSLAYVLDGRRGLEVFDMTDPPHPRLIGNLGLHLPSDVYDPDPPPIWLELKDKYGYLTNGSDGFRVIDLRDPRHPNLVAHLPLDGYTYTAAVRGNRAYLANVNLGLLVLDISRPESPTILKVCETPGGAYDIILRGDRGYLSDGAKGFLILDIHDLDNPRPMGYLRTPMSASGVTLAGNTLIVCNGSAGLDFYDVSNRGDPRHLSHVETKGLAVQASVTGNRVLVADVLGGALLVDISDREHPRTVATFIPEDHPWGIANDGEYAYVANAHHGFAVIDLKGERLRPIFNDYTQPKEGGWGYLIRARKVGKAALITDLVRGMCVYDVSDPTHPKRAASYPEPTHPLFNFFAHGAFLRPIIGIDGAGSMAYLAAYDRGLDIVDVSNPMNPRRVGRLPLEGYVYGVSHRNGLAAVCEYGGRVHLVDVSNPKAPRRIRSWQVRGELQDLAFSENNKIYVAAGAEGLAVIDLENDSISYFPIVAQKLNMLECRDANEPPPPGRPLLLQEVNMLPMALGGGPADMSVRPCPPCKRRANEAAGDNFQP